MKVYILRLNDGEGRPLTDWPLELLSRLAGHIRSGGELHLDDGEKLPAVVEQLGIIINLKKQGAL